MERISEEKIKTKSICIKKKQEEMKMVIEESMVKGNRYLE